MKTPNASVVIDSYNSAAFLAEAIESVLAQVHPLDEIIISDASTDHSPEIVRSYAAKDKRIKPVFTGNRGQLATILAGAEAATGEWVFFLDGDDRYKPDHLAKRMQRILEFPEADIFYGRHEAIGDEALLQVVRARDKHENADWLGPIDLEKPYDWGRSAALAWCTPHFHVGGVSATLAMRREHFMSLPLRRLCEETGYSLQANADYMILLASALYGGRKIYAPDRTVDYRVHVSSITGSYAAGHDPSFYIQRYYCFLARNWLCGLPQFGPSLFELLDLEMATVPAMSAGHREMYERAKKLRPRRREEMLQAKLESIERSLSWKLTAPFRAAGKVFGIG